VTIEKIGIITCSNATNDMDCCAAPCLRDLENQVGTFERYKGREVKLVGLISCAGCPTKIYPEKIMRKVKTLVEFDINVIHFSYCMVALCPFLDKYINVVKKKYPEIELVKGTHDSHITVEQYQDYVKTTCIKGMKMNDVIFRRVKE